MNKSPYKVSVGVPVYNAERYIERCVRSIFDQDYNNLEIILVDDCSQDRSLDVAQKVLLDYPMRSSQFRIVRHTRNMGVSVARNTLLSYFSGLFCTFVDADDYLNKNAISKLVQRQCIDNCDLVTGSVFVNHGKWTQIIEEPEYDNVDSMLLHLCSSPTHHENFARLFRLSLIRDNRVTYKPEIRIAEDHIFLTHVACFINKIAKVKDVVYYYDYTNEASAMHQILREGRACKVKLADIIALQEIKKIIANKGNIYTDGVERQIAKNIEEGLIMAVKCKNVEIFNELSAYVNSISPSNVDSHYLIKRLCLKGRLFYHIHSIYLWIRMKKYKLFMKLKKLSK